ncbi:NAD-dependent epimerase/dehydratase family protein [Candidatus Pelagibacter communis]|uniref:NAD-dependent epimerase/dehydratase family protein n=1 Tax=Candidatus Pelagibacter TaxID=198251 RepID=UPI003EDF0EC8
MNILITGVAGFIGFHTAEKLLKKNNNIIGIDNLNNFYDQKLKNDRIKYLKKHYREKFVFYKKDLKNKRELNSIFLKKKIKLVINLAAQAGVRYSLKKPREYLNSNIIGFFNLIEVCKEFNVKRLVFASTSSVYGNNIEIPFKESHTADHPIQFYAATKRSNELIAHAYSSLYGIETVGLRFFTVYGPWGRPDMALFKFVKNIIQKKPIEIFNFGKHVRDFTYIDDIINGLVLATFSKKIFKKKLKTKVNLTPDHGISKFRILNIGSGKQTELMKYIKIIEKELKIKAIKKYLPLQKGDIQETLSHVNNFKKLGYNPKTNPEIGIKKFIKWYKEYYKIKL